MAQDPIEAVELRSEADIISTRNRAMDIAKGLGFGATDQTRIATAVSELTRNALEYGGGGRATIRVTGGNGTTGLEVVVEDQGPGIRDLELVLKGGYSTSGGLGLGLLGSKRLMDEFEIYSKPGAGTRVTIRKWL